MSNAQKEFIVTVRDYDLLEEFYTDMESAETSAVHLPKRSVPCVLRRPVSRNTHYFLTDDEARAVAKDSRVESVTVKVKGLGIKTKLHSDQLGTWNRGSSIAVGENNYGLYRISLENNPLGWGSEGNSEQTANIRLSLSGKNVDVIVVDETAYPNHSEFDNRLIQYDWYNQLDEFVKGSGVLISAVERTNNSAAVTMQAPHGLKIGEVINITCSDSSFSSAGAIVTGVTSATAIQYSNPGIDVISASATGSWRGVYQYTDYSGPNNHATHVAAIIGGTTQGWAKDVNLYNLKHNADAPEYDNFTYPDSDLLFDYVRQFHARKPVNPQTGTKNPTLVNNSWGFGAEVNFLVNPYTGYTFPRFSNLYYRGVEVLPAGSVVDTGISGIYTATALLDSLSIAPSSGNRIATSDGVTGSVSSIAFENTGSVGLTSLGDPTVSDAGGVDPLDDAYWTVALPFGISYLGTTYNEVYVVSNSFVTFGAGSTAFFLGAQAPQARKIFISAGDRSCDAVYGGVTGTAGNRIYTVRWEGYEGAYGNLLGGGIDMIWEMKFYEATPAQIDVHVISNAAYRAEFTREELASYGLNMSGPVAPYRNTAMDADIQDAIDEGIIFVGSAGNSATRIETDQGLDYDNYFIDNGLPIFYHRGSSPGASANVICVGAVASSSVETKFQLSNSGPRVDLYAPGENIVSAVYNGAANINPIVNDGSASAALAVGSSVASGGSAEVTVSTTLPHNFINGATVTIPDCSTSFFNSDRVAITVIDTTTFSYPISTNISTGFASTTGTNAGKFLAVRFGADTYAVTNSGASAYVINSSNNPTLNLKRGWTYTFNVNASGHPFWIKTAAVTGTGSTYSAGVTNNGAAVGTVTFVVPQNAPNTLYYICQFHGSMLGTINITDADADVTTLDINMAVVFTEQTGSLTLNGSAINSSTVYYVEDINYNTNEFTLSTEPDGVALTAAGTGTATVRNKITGTAYQGFLYQKYSGTSMAAAQVTGLLAAALEKYPRMNQQDARNYIISYAKDNKMTVTTGSYIDATSLQGGENKFAFYHKERPDTGITVPRSKEWLRPNAGLLFPRPVIKRK